MDGLLFESKPIKAATNTVSRPSETKSLELNLFTLPKGLGGGGLDE